MLFIFCFISCERENKTKTLTAESIIEKAITQSGTKAFKEAEVKFQFRNKKYKSIPTCEGFKYIREFKENQNHVVDELHRGEFSRTVNQTKEKVKDSLAFLYAESINSVFYFVQLPYRLNDDAVKKEWVGTENDSLNTYYKIKISFEKEGGGADYEDEYYYWFDTETFQIGYLAYSFHVNGGGIRFRKATHQQKVDSIQFITYNNYQPITENLTLENSLQDYLKGKYEYLSTIENTSIQINQTNLNCN